MKHRWIAALLLTLGVMQSVGEEAKQWSTVGEWIIAVDATLENSCFAIRSYPDGTGLRIGLNAANTEWPWYVMFGNEDWRSIEEGKEYDISMQFDREAEWTAIATGINMGDPEYNFLYIFGSDFTFFDEFTRKLRLTLNYNGQAIASLDLRGSSKAAEAVALCQKQQTSATPSDPFSATPEGAPTDPFAT